MRNGQRPIIGYNSDGSPKVNPDANYSETGFSTQKRPILQSGSMGLQKEIVIKMKM